ncbi:putative nucleoside triphosphate pyrophosphohydrolase [Actinacidiphila reveromycinica]|uniref:Putative nucleoside triphosphate pyrophosphohydrolase n=1 Tax=Actinacidiphila reveromycinica TaxID=659352 RepID=A0A7U3USA5_9ACTN|nr:nucleoside triphosphate pyrophosphohydrolase [Streptomyces sp. SN-593]BBA97761.1 putative nucleoside triphosphate pyrophosphohydrolase [Streptomyces sp. SN-593]
MTEEPDAVPAGRLVLLTMSHRVAPGLLSWPAWQVLRAADRVLCADPEHPQLPYLRQAGIAVEAATPTGQQLVDAAAGGRTVVYLPPDAGADRAVTDELARLGGSGRVAMPELELLPGSYDLPGARLLDLVRVMDRIRAECPWSAVRTHEDLAPYGIEEMYELVEAIEEGDRTAVREELGDVLLQVAFHAAVAEDDPEDPYDIDDVAAGLIAKLVHRHPHVFGDEHASTPEEVREIWARRKSAEKVRESVTEGVPVAAPALALAAKLASRAGDAGLPVPAAPAGPVPDGEDALGDHLLALAAAAQAAGLDPERALRHAARRYRAATKAAEAAARSDADHDGNGRTVEGG